MGTPNTDQKKVEQCDTPGCALPWAHTPPCSQPANAEEPMAGTEPAGAIATGESLPPSEPEPSAPTEEPEDSPEPAGAIATGESLPPSEPEPSAPTEEPEDSPELESNLEIQCMAFAVDKVSGRVIAAATMLPITGGHDARSRFLVFTGKTLEQAPATAPDTTTLFPKEQMAKV